jgi:regulator of protease activity HflC (stomatin/prohibitin superfamily)
MKFDISKLPVGALGITLVIFLAILLLNSFRSIDPGHEGVHYRPFGGGIDTENVYEEGVHFILPWNDVIEYDMRKLTQDLSLSVLDSKGLTVNISMSVINRIQTGKSPLIHLEVGQNYPEAIIKPTVLAIVRDIVGGYRAEDLYSIKRNELQQKAETSMSEELAKYHIIVADLLIKDVDLPSQIETAIIAKEEQEQRNLLAEKKKTEAYELALAKVQTAKGDSASRVINEQAEAEAIKIKQLQLAKSPQYIEYLKAQAVLETAMKWNGSYGEGNVFGDSPLLLKNLK